MIYQPPPLGNSFSIKREDVLLVVFFLGFYLITVLRNAWTCDDAYISFRTIDNFVNGYGLTWNVSERVQAFTHPLWVLLLAPVYALLGDMYFTAILVSVVLSLAAVAWFAFRLAPTAWAACLGILVLALSDAFVDFSTSGLENPLTYFCLIVFLYIYFRRDFSVMTLLLLSFWAALGAVNRLDTMVMYIPMLAYAFWKVRGKRAIYALILGFSPLILWEVFSLIYYGFLIPNTAYSKLWTGLDSSIIIKQGISYLINSIYVDPLTVAVIAVGIVLPFAIRDRKSIPVALAVVFQLIYIIKIGGCFMSGRYLAAPLLIGVVLVVQYFRVKSPSLWSVGLPAVVILMLGLTTPYSPLYYSVDDSPDNFELKNTINDERCFYNPTCGLMNYDRLSGYWPSHGWGEDGRYVRNTDQKVIMRGTMGMYGFYVGPDKHVIDVHGLTDPFLARLKIYPGTVYKIGHYRRQAPPGYIRSVETGTNMISDSNLATFYDKLQIVTRGPIFSFNRFWEIIKFNLGVYDDLAKSYYGSSPIIADLRVFNEPRPDGTNWLDSRNVVFLDQGVRIRLGDVYHAAKVEFSRDHNDSLKAIFCLDGLEIASQIIPSQITSAGGLTTSIIDVPAGAVADGYDEIMVFPHRGDGYYSLGHIRIIEDEVLTQEIESL